MAKVPLIIIALILLLPVRIFSPENKGVTGWRLYLTYCSPCHGQSGKGDGSGGELLPVKPTDHTDGKVMNKHSDKYLIDIISKGGATMGKSPFMPAWGGEFKEKQLREIIAFIRGLAVPPYNPNSRD